MERINVQPGGSGSEEKIEFHVGTYDLHPNESLNFQMNRWIAYLGERGAEDMRAIAPRIKNYADWKREFTALAQRSLAEGRPIHAAYYFRAAEFFTFSDDPDKKALRDQFLDLLRKGYGVDRIARHLIPYADGPEKGCLPAYRITPDSPKSTIVLFGGFDSYIEEFLPALLYIADHGYDVICFEGPGQGGALEDYGLHMTHAWQKPVKAVLDYFQADDVTLIGLSLGGCFVLRAAAFEPRVRRAIADDVMYNFFDINLGKAGGAAKILLRAALKARAAPLVNALIARKIRRSALVEWGIKQGMHVTGTNTPYDYLKTVEKYTTSDISDKVRQDVLIMAGNRDHYIPVGQFYSQIRALSSARSLTARLFTAEEHAGNHCQFGNFGLALDFMMDWVALAERSGDRQMKGV